MGPACSHGREHNSKSVKNGKDERERYPRREGASVLNAWLLSDLRDKLNQMK